MIVIVGRGFFIDKFGKVVHLTPGVSALISLNSNATFICDAVTLFVVASTRIENSSTTIVSCVRRFCFRSTTVVLTLVAIKGVLRTRSGNGAASTLGNLVGLTPGATAVMISSARGAIPVSRIGGNSVFTIGPNRDVPISKIIVSNRDTIGRSTLANRDIPISGLINSAISTTAVGRSKCVHYRTAEVNRSAALSRVVGVIDGTSTAGTPVTGVTSEMSNIFIPTIVAVTIVATVI